MDQPDASAAIKALGGPRELADRLSRESRSTVSRTAVSNWRLPGRGIPWRWRAVIEKMLRGVK